MKKYVEDVILPDARKKAKKGFTNKPLSMGSWACIDAKIEDDTIFSETLTPKDIVNECQELIKENGF